MADTYVAILNQNGGTMEFGAFKAAAQAQGVDVRLWLRAKHAGKLFTMITPEGVHMISVNPFPQS